MVGLDSLYAMLARPVRQVTQRKRMVEQTEHIEGVHADSHEAPQSQLPPNLERRHNIFERRESSRGDRRGQSARDDTMLKAEKEALESPLPHIDIDV
ncbi:hypothetical protein ACQKE0_14680 [Shewanella colwelliana]|uniref:hypothetical protein n=1 Tax=Shewanella colwelliana TaxID=23 RepID=UPI003D08AD6F